MAKKAAKKEAPAAKAKKATKAVATKAPAKKAAAKAPAKPAKSAVSAKAPPAAKPAKTAKPEKAAKPVAAKKTAAPAAPPPQPEKIEKKPKLEIVSEEAAAPKKEKKVKIDRTGLNEDQIKWHELHEKYKAVKAPAYSISGQFEARTPLQHKVFGWGFILSNEYDRLEVLFEDGKRMLISNRKLS